MTRCRKGKKQRNGRLVDPIAATMRTGRQKDHATTSVRRADLPAERRCSLSSMHVCLTDSNSDAGAVKPRVVYEKLAMPEQSMSLVVRQLDRKMDLDFVLVDNPNGLQAETMFSAVVKARIKLPDDRYTISFGVYQPRFTMEVIRWPKAAEEQLQYSRFSFCFDHYSRDSFRDGRPVWNMILAYLRASNATELAVANVPRPALQTNSLSGQVLSRLGTMTRNDQLPALLPNNPILQNRLILPTRLHPHPRKNKALPHRSAECDGDTAAREERLQPLTDEQIKYMTESIQQFNLDEPQYLELPVTAHVSKHPWALIGHWQDPEILELIRDFMGTDGQLM